MFVVGTTKDRGRVSSHPYRSQKAVQEAKSKSGCPVSKSPEPSSAANTDVEGHEDAVTTVENADEKEVRCVALHARLEALEPIYHEEWDSFKLPTLAPCLPAPTSANPALDMSFQAVCLIPAEPTSQHKHPMQESSSVSTDSSRRGEQVTNETQACRSDQEHGSRYMFIPLRLRGNCLAQICYGLGERAIDFT